MAEYINVEDLHKAMYHEIDVVFEKQPDLAGYPNIVSTRGIWVRFKWFQQLLDNVPKTYISKTQWISVKDRLPKESGHVLVFTDCNMIYMVPFSAKHQLFNVRDTDKSCRTAIKGITHWMPLPDQPKENEV